MSEYRERKPTSKGLLARVKCQQRNARIRERDSFSLSQASWIGSMQKSCYVAGSITSQSFPDFLNLSESCQKKAVFVQRHNTPLEVPSNGIEVILVPSATRLECRWRVALVAPKNSNFFIGWQKMDAQQKWKLQSSTHPISFPARMAAGALY